MSKSQVKALSSFIHGPYNMAKNATLEMPKAHADELAKAGLVSVESEDDEAEEKPTKKPTQAPNGDEGQAKTQAEEKERAEAQRVAAFQASKAAVAPVKQSANKAEGDSGKATRPANAK